MENPDHPLFEGESLLKISVKGNFEVSSPWIGTRGKKQTNAIGKK